MIAERSETGRLERGEERKDGLLIRRQWVWSKEYCYSMDSPVLDINKRDASVRDTA